MKLSIKDVIGRIAVMGAERSVAKETRDLALGAAKLFAGPVAKARETLEGIAEMAAAAEAEYASWTDAEDLDVTAPGPETRAFQTTDLRAWLKIAEAAGVPVVPAREILRLTEEELASVQRPIKLPSHVETALGRRGARVASTFAPEDIAEARRQGDIERARAADLRGPVWERAFEAMDEVPEGWMVRTQLSGSTMLKSLAGSGVLGNPREGAILAPQVEVGAGWVRAGNRRRVDLTDWRFVELIAKGHNPTVHFLARPWVEPARMVRTEDPHRHGSQFAGKGLWPCEWRVFVENGEVTGVASYYPWTGEATPENARMALAAADAARRIVDKARELNLATRFMDLELLRHGQAKRAKDGQPIHPQMAELLARFPADGIHCTLDFIEAEEGLLLLEGGPAHMPIGAAHPCAFAGHNAKAETGVFSDCRGVALRLMDHVSLVDGATCVAGDTAGCILSWEEARRLAEIEDLPEPA